MQDLIFENYEDVEKKKKEGGLKPEKRWNANELFVLRHKINGRIIEEFVIKVERKTNGMVYVTDPDGRWGITVRNRDLRKYIK